MTLLRRPFCASEVKEVSPGVNKVLDATTVRLLSERQGDISWAPKDLIEFMVCQNILNSEQKKHLNHFCFLGKQFVVLVFV